MVLLGKFHEVVAIPPHQAEGEEEVVVAEPSHQVVRRAVGEGEEQ